MNNTLTTLWSLKTIRERANHLLRLAKQNKLQYFRVDESQLIPTASFVSEVILEQYPTLEIPYHSRWRHFEAGDVQRVESLLQKINHFSSLEQGQILCELAIISVFLDAGAGPQWQYQEKGHTYSRSEGLALASLALYQEGALSNNPNTPFRVDIERLLNFQEKDLCHFFQVTADNPLAGLAGRVTLLNRLGKILQEKKWTRLGDFYLPFHEKKELDVETLFLAVLNAFNAVWPPRLQWQNTSLGDVWVHCALKNERAASEYMPFHKLSQWLTYSLLEPLEWQGLRFQNLEKLTGLPEYRNGGLLIDLGLLQVKNPQMLEKIHEVSEEFIVEWRALTLALLDELAFAIRENLKCDSQTLPLAKILQGGTWEAGRRIAKQKRIDGAPPIQILSDGTVF